MRKLRIGIIDVLGKTTSRTLYARAVRANRMSIMPQAVAVWCEEEGHDVFFGFYNGYENMIEELPENLDLVFMGAFTHSAQLVYALSNRFRSQGTVTVLGGPHARGFPEDAQKYFDYVLGFTVKALIRDIVQDCAPHRPLGVYLAATQQPLELPGVRARWKYIEAGLNKAFLFKSVPMIGSLGCPYTCSFCIDALVPYQPLDFDEMKKDLRFLLTKFKKPMVGWHDPNFGVRFNDYLGMIEEAVRPGSIDFLAESTLSLLSEKNVQRLKKNGFKAILPGIESWYEMGYKAKARNTKGMAKVEQVAEQVNMILSYLPYLQANFVLGLDCDSGAEPWALTKRFLDLAPGSFPALSMLTAFGRSAPLNLEYQREDRVIAFPFHFINCNGVMNVRPKHYDWPTFYDYVIDLNEHAYGPSGMRKRWRANRGFVPRVFNVMRSVSSMTYPNAKGWGETRYYREIRRRLDEDLPFRRFFEQETTEIPSFFINIMKRDLGPLWHWLPEGALHHDPYIYLKTEGLVEPSLSVAMV